MESLQGLSIAVVPANHVETFAPTETPFGVELPERVSCHTVVRLVIEDVVGSMCNSLLSPLIAAKIGD